MGDEGRRRAHKGSTGSGNRLRSFTSDKLLRDTGGSDDENSRENLLGGGGSGGGKEGGPGGNNQAEDKFKSVRDKLHSRERRVAEDEPELHVIGEVEGGDDFGSGVCCRWQFDFGATWHHLGGYLEGQTHIDYPRDGESAVWAHPIDVHFLCKGLQGWPRLLLQVWKMDEHGQLNLGGYGFTHVPNQPGSYELEVATWRPMGTLKEEIAAQFLGTTPQLRDINLLFSKAWSDRCRLSTTSSGTVRLNIEVVTRFFHEHSVDS